MGAGSYLIRRLLLLIPTLFGLSLLTFAISHIVPADPAKLAAGPRASNEMVETIRRQFGLDRPLPEQYITYVGGLLRGNFGDSITTRRSVGEDLKDRFPATFELVLYAMILAVGVGIPLGVIAAVNQNHWPVQLSRLFAISSVSIPPFWFGLVLQLFFASSLGWLPLSRRLPTLAQPPERITGLLSIDSLLAGQMDTFWLTLKHLALPVFVLSLGSMAIIGLSFGWTLGGTVLVEAVFDWPGIGNYAVEATGRLDFNPIMGVTLLVGIVFILINLAVDLLYGVLDPRITYQ